MRDFRLHHTANRYVHGVVDGELLAADVEGIESIGAVGAVFEQVFFRFGEFLARLVLAEAVAPSAHSCRLDGKDKVGVVAAVEERHEALLASEALIDKQILLVVAHRVAEIDRFHLPAVAFKLVDDYPAEVLFVDGIVTAQCGSVVVEDDHLVLVGSVVVAEVVNKRRDFALELDVEGLDDVQASASRLPSHNPVDVCIVVHADADRRIGVVVFVGTSVKGSCVEVVGVFMEVMGELGVIGFLLHLLGFPRLARQTNWGVRDQLPQTPRPRCRGFRPVLVEHLRDFDLDIRYRLNAKHSWVVRSREGLHMDWVERYSLLVLQIHTVKLAVGSGGTLHLLAVFACLCHVVGGYQHLVGVPAVEVSARTTQCRKQGLHNSKVRVCRAPTDVVTLAYLGDKLAVSSVGVGDKPVIHLTDTQNLIHKNLRITALQVGFTCEEVRAANFYGTWYHGSVGGGIVVIGILGELGLLVILHVEEIAVGVLDGER